MELTWNEKEEKWPLPSLERPLKIDLASKKINNVNNNLLLYQILYFKENVFNTKNALLSANCGKKIRPKSMVYLKPSSKNYTNESFKRVKSCKNVSNTNQSSKFIEFLNFHLI